MKTVSRKDISSQYSETNLCMGGLFAFVLAFAYTWQHFLILDPIRPYGWVTLNSVSSLLMQILDQVSFVSIPTKPTGADP